MQAKKCVLVKSSSLYEKNKKGREECILIENSTYGIEINEL